MRRYAYSALARETEGKRAAEKVLLLLLLLLRVVFSVRRWERRRRHSRGSICRRFGGFIHALSLSPSLPWRAHGFPFARYADALHSRSLAYVAAACALYTVHFQLFWNAAATQNIIPLLFSSKHSAFFSCQKVTKILEQYAIIFCTILSLCKIILRDRLNFSRRKKVRENAAFPKFPDYGRKGKRL